MLERFSRELSGEFLRVADDGRTVTGRIVPYDEPAEVDDGDGRYVEVFTAVSLARMLEGFSKEPHRARNVGLNLEHREDLEHRLGFATVLESRGDGCHATFELYPHRAELARSMLSTSHTGLSINFGCDKTRVRPDGARERLGVHVFHVAATPVPAYAGAQITGIRADGDVAELGAPRLEAAIARFPDMFGVTSPATHGTP